MGSHITHRAAVLGSPIEHSKSPVLHNTGYKALGLDQWEYDRFECTGDMLPGIVSGADETYRGFSVTMPSKFAALEFADEVTERARAIGSANTLLRTETGWRADNTDVDGIRGALGELLGGASLSGKHAIVIGSGGTARPAIWALIEVGVARITVLNRSDRTAANGDVANKIGTYMLALAAYDNGVPFYPVVPTSTIDLSLASGDLIPIEERDPQEVLGLEFMGERVAPRNAKARNIAFDVTPNRLVTGIVTENGVAYPPFEVSLKRLVKR